MEASWTISPACGNLGRLHNGTFTAAPLRHTTPAPALAGVYREGHEPLAPIGHVLTSANIEITLNAQGGFETARRVEKNEPKILIPVTEESGGRTSGIAAHPLCEQLKYMACTNAQAHESYLAALRAWMESPHGHPFLPAIFTYVMKGTLLSDLTKGGVLDLTEKGEYNEKLLVCWRVLGIDGEEPACWKNRNLFAAFEAYYGGLLAAREEVLCMVEGKGEPTALQHPKGIIPINGNAKLISANDGSGFTYRGRFLDERQAATVGYIASQKAHKRCAGWHRNRAYGSLQENEFSCAGTRREKRSPDPCAGCAVQRLSRCESPASIKSSCKAHF